MLFFSLKMIEFLVDKTNITIRRWIQKHTGPTRNWFRETSVPEMKAFIGLWLYRGLHHDVKEPSHELWNSPDAARPMYRAVLSHNRFKFLLYSLTFHDHDMLVREELNG